MPLNPHPEKQDDEVLLSITFIEDFETMGWKSKRMGEKPYLSANGEPPCKHEDMFPVFVKKTEVLERIEKYKDLATMLEDLLKQ